MSWQIHESFTDWLKRNLNVAPEDYANIANLVVMNTDIKTGNKEPDKISKDTIFKLTPSKNGKVFKIEDEGEDAPEDRTRPKFPHSAGHGHAGRKYYLKGDDFSKIIQPKSPPQPPAGGMPGM